jgi:hypothetical protein
MLLTVLGIISGLIPIIWAIINRGTTKQDQAKAVTRHSVRELHIGTARVRKHT